MKVEGGKLENFSIGKYQSFSRLRAQILPSDFFITSISSLLPVRDRDTEDARNQKFSIILLKNPPQDYHGSLTREFVWQFKKLLKVFVGGVWSKVILEVNISNSSWWFYGLQHLFQYTLNRVESSENCENE